MENESALGRKVQGHVGLETNLRKLALLLSDDRSSLSGRINVRQPLALADDLFRRGAHLSRGWIGRAIETS